MRGNFPQPMPTSPDIAILWKRNDGTACVLSKRGTHLFLSLQRAGAVEREQAVNSPREAMDLAKRWQGGAPSGAPSES
jgi:hypothetical protein